MKAQFEQREWRGQFKNQILTYLRERNKKESDGFTELFRNYQNILEGLAKAKAENERLHRIGSDARRVSVVSSGTETRREAMTYEERILDLEEEVNDLQRRRGEYAHQILDLSGKVSDRDLEINRVQKELSDAVARVDDLEEQLRISKLKVKEVGSSYELMRDEHQALQLAYASLEQRYLVNVKENLELVERYMEIKAQHAELMNQENENFVKKRQAKVQKDLEDAAKEVRCVVETAEEALAAGSSLIIDYCLVPKTPTYAVDTHDSEVNTVRWSPNGKLFATGGMDRKVKIWEVTNTGPELRITLTGANASILSVDYDSTTSALVAASSTDFAVRVWTLDDHRLRHTLTGHTGKVLGARFLGEPTKVVSGSNDRTLKIWDLRSRACVSTKFAGSSCHDLVCVDSASIISGHFDKRIRFWDARTDTPTHEVTLPGKITSLDLSLDKNFLLASVRDDSIEVLDLRINTIIGQYTADGFKVSTDCDRACFSPNGRYVACGSSDGSIYVWSVMENKVDTVLKEHTAPVVAVHWHPSGGFLLSADKTKKTIVWTP